MAANLEMNHVNALASRDRETCGTRMTFLSLSGGTGIQAYGGGTGTILLDDVGCTGSESRLWQCTNRGIGVHNCVHSEDAGVTCTAVRKSVRIYITYCIACKCFFFYYYFMHVINYHVDSSL